MTDKGKLEAMHTPLPWSFRYSRHQEYIIDGDSGKICALASVVDEHDAEYIVLACNGWSNIEALKARLAQLESEQ